MSAATENFEVEWDKESKNICVHTVCPWCGEQHDVVLTAAQWRKINSGQEHIQIALPELSAEERELLMTGICTTCWDNYLGD